MGTHILIRRDFYTETTARSRRNRLFNSVCIAFSYFPRICIYAKSSRHWVSFESSNQIIHIPIYSLDSRYPERYPFMYTTDSWYTGKLTHFFISVASPRKLLPSQASQFRAHILIQFFFEHLMHVLGVLFVKKASIFIIISVFFSLSFLLMPQRLSVCWTRFIDAGSPSVLSRTIR